MAEVQEYNPFLAPVSATIEAGQPDQSLGDKEYVVLPRRILCREKVVLPEIYVFYGDTEGIEPRQRTLRIMKPKAVFFLVLQSFSLLLMSVIIFDNSLSWWIRGFLALFALYLVCGAGVLTWRKGRDKVQVTWHVCRRYRQRAALERRIAQVFIVSTGTALLFAMPYVDLPFRFLFVAVVAGMFAGLRLQCEESLNVTGKKDDVYTLLGHKKKFFEAVRRQENQF